MGRVTAGPLASRARVASARRGTGCNSNHETLGRERADSPCRSQITEPFGCSRISLPRRRARGTKRWAFSGPGGAVVSEGDALSPEGGTQGRDLRPGQADLRDAG